MLTFECSHLAFVPCTQDDEDTFCQRVCLSVFFAKVAGHRSRSKSRSIDRSIDRLFIFPRMQLFRNRDSIHSSFVVCRRRSRVVCLFVCLFVDEQKCKLLEKLLTAEKMLHRASTTSTRATTTHFIFLRFASHQSRRHPYDIKMSARDRVDLARPAGCDAHFISMIIPYTFLSSSSSSSTVCRPHRAMNSAFQFDRDATRRDQDEDEDVGGTQSNESTRRRRPVDAPSTKM